MRKLLNNSIVFELHTQNPNDFQGWLVVVVCFPDENQQPIWESHRFPFFGRIKNTCYQWNLTESAPPAIMCFFWVGCEPLNHSNNHNHDLDLDFGLDLNLNLKN